MLTQRDRQENLRKDIITAARVYSQELAGKDFLYVIGEQYFEVSFRVKCFKHLTGVSSSLSAKNFYEKARKGQLMRNQFLFDSRHPYSNARKKVSCLIRLPELTNDFVCVLHNLNTLTFVYTLGVTNLEFTVAYLSLKTKTGTLLTSFICPSPFV